VEPRRARGHQNQDAASGPTKIEGRSLLVRGLNALAAAICTALGTPLIAATRLRGGNANAARDTVSFAAEVAGAARAADAPRWSSCWRTRRSTAARSTGLAPGARRGGRRSSGQDLIAVVTALKTLARTSTVSRSAWVRAWSVVPAGLIAAAAATPLPGACRSSRAGRRTLPAAAARVGPARRHRRPVARDRFGLPACQAQAAFMRSAARGKHGKVVLGVIE
jgi:hypothetical protein